MTRTLQNGLRGLGLVAEPEKQSSKEDKTYIQRRLESYPLNRLGKPVIWAKWLVRRRTPKNLKRRCCLCGLSVRKDRIRELTEDNEWTETIQEEFAERNLEFDGPAMLCKYCL